MLKQHRSFLDFPRRISPHDLCSAPLRSRRGEAINDVFGPSKLEKSPMQKAAMENGDREGVENFMDFHGFTMDL